MSQIKNVSEAFPEDDPSTLAELPTSPTVAVPLEPIEIREELTRESDETGRDVLAARLSAHQFLADGHDFRAADMLMKIIRLAPDDVPARRLLASILERNDETEAAKAIYEELLEIHAEKGEDTLLRLTRAQLKR